MSMKQWLWGGGALLLTATQALAMTGSDRDGPGRVYKGEAQPAMAQGRAQPTTASNVERAGWPVEPDVAITKDPKTGDVEVRVTEAQLDHASGQARPKR